MGYWYPDRYLMLGHFSHIGKDFSLKIFVNFLINIFIKKI